MENSSTSKLRRQPLVPTRSKGQHIDIRKRGHNHLAEARAEDGRRHEFSLDSLDKEILQTMSRDTSKNVTHINLPSDSASESSGSTQEKAICSWESPHPEPVPYIIPNGVHSSESTSKTSKKPSEQHHGQFHAPLLPMWPEAEARSNGYKQQVSVNVNEGKLQQQDPGHWHHSGEPLHRPRGNNDLQVSQPKDSIFRDVHSLSGRPSPDAGLSSETNGDQDIGEEIRRKQASEGPYSGSVGGQSQQRSATKSKVPKAPPSKWDDAGKWIASPVHGDSATTDQGARSNPGFVPSPLSLPGIRLAVAEQVFDDCNKCDSPNLAASIVDPLFSLNDNRITSSVNENSTSSASVNSSPFNEISTSSISEKASSANGITSLANGNTSLADGNTSSANGNTGSANGSSSSVRVKDQIKQIECAIQSSLAKGPSISDIAKRREAPRAGAKSAVDRRDTSVITSTMFVQRPKDSRLDGLMSPPNLLVEPQAAQNQAPIFPIEQPPLAVPSADAPVKDIFSNSSYSRSISSSVSIRESTGTGSALTTPSIYRDMGTQMTPNPSSRLSRGAIPGKFHISPGRHNTPDHSRRTASLGTPPNEDMADLQSFHMEKLGRRNLGPQPHPLLDRNLNWSTREEEEEESATCLRTVDCGETQTGPYVAWAAAWEEAERAKYTARFHQEEARIQAWEELQKAKAETEMKKVEVKLEKMHEGASQKMFNKIAAAHRKAEDMRAAAEACRDELATRAKHRAEYIRQTGHVPSALGCFASRLVPFQSNLQ